MNTHYSKKFNKTLLIKSGALLICLFFSIFFNLSNSYSKIISYNKTVILKRSGEIIFFEEKLIENKDCINEVVKNINLSETYKVLNASIKAFNKNSQIPGTFREETRNNKKLIYEFEESVCNKEVLIKCNYTFFPGLILQKEDIDALIHLEGEKEKIKELIVMLISPEEINKSVFWVKPYSLKKEVVFLNETSVKIIFEDIPKNQEIFIRTLFPKKNFTGFFLGGNMRRETIINYENEERKNEKKRKIQTIICAFLFILILLIFAFYKFKHKKRESLYTHFNKYYFKKYKK